MRITALLPQTSFVSFPVVAANNAHLLWLNRNISPKGPIDNYLLTARAPTSGKQRKRTTFALADRYGGEGVGHNSGSGRCGLLDDVCIKGIGRTPLAASSTDYFHSYGGASILEGILEVVWGEVLDCVLPFGATRVFALWTTGENVRLRYPRSFGPILAPGALILREQNIRPAHFMRACSQGASRLSPNGISDTDRTRSAIRQWNPKEVVNCEGVAWQCDLTEAAREGARRTAQQIARARARRIMHGSLTPSNFDLDGRWLDFTSATTLPDYGRIVIPRAAPDFMHEDKLVLRGLVDLDFYIKKFTPQYHEVISPRADFHLADPFVHDLGKTLPKEFAILLGYTADLVEKLPSRITQRFYEASLGISRPGNAHPRTILSKDNDYLPSLPVKTGRYRLGDVITTLSACRDVHQANIWCAQLVGESALCAQIVDAWWNLREAAVAIDPDLRRHSRLVVSALAALRLNLPHWPLCRTRLYPNLESIILFPAATSSFVNSLIRYGKCNLSEAPPANHSITLALDDLKSTVEYSDEGGFLLNGHPLTATNAIDAIANGVYLSRPGQEAFRALVGEAPIVGE